MLAKGYNGNGVGGSLAVIAGTWPTPNATDGDKAPEHYSRGPSNPSLPAAAKGWQTARVSAGGYTRDRGDPMKSRPTLEGQAALWSSPSVADVEGGRTSRSGDRKDELLLNTQAKAASCPSCLPALVIWRLGPPCWRDRLTALRLYRTLTSPRAPTWPRLRSWAARATRPKLSAAFVEWLMGWPPGWTACACSATELSRFKARMRSALSALPSHDAPPAQPSLFG